MIIKDSTFYNIPTRAGTYVKALRVYDGAPTYIFVDAQQLGVSLKPLWSFLETFYTAPPPTTYDIPVPIGKELLDFQITGVCDILNRTNTLLADEMGLGKTIEALAVINVLKPARVLIICPNNLKLNWRKECEEWLVDARDIEIADTKIFLYGDFVIMSYETLARWAPGMTALTWDLLIVDEAHFVKNPAAQRSKAVYQVTKTADRVIYMTGTPIVNYPYEAAPLMHALDPGYWPSTRLITERYTYNNGKYGRHLNELQNLLRERIMTRRLKKDVLTSLPKKRRQIIEFSAEGFEELLAEERRVFEGRANDDNTIIQELIKVASETKEGTDIDWASMIESLKYTKKYFFEAIARIRHKVAVAKLPLVLEHLDEVVAATNSECKLVVFGHHLDVLNTIHDHFPKSVIVTGETDIRDRFEAVEHFQNDPTVNVFVGGMKVAGLGITLTASSHVVFVELDWVPGTLTQAEDRLHRIGQEASSVLIQHLVLEDSIDAYMAKKVIAKQKQIDKALNR